MPFALPYIDQAGYDQLIANNPQYQATKSNAVPSSQRFALPAFADPNWKAPTTQDILGADYVAPDGGPSLEDLNSSPGWQSILSLLGGAPVASIANSNDIPTLLQNVLSGVQKLEGGPLPDQMDSAATYIAPMPGQQGWVNPQWAPGAMPGDAPPPAPSTDDLGRIFYPSDVSSETGQAFDPFRFGAPTPGSWLDQAQQNFPQGAPSAPVVNQWNPQRAIQPTANAQGGYSPWVGAPQPAAPPVEQGRVGYWQTHNPNATPDTPRPGVGANNAPWGAKPWYS